MLLLSNTKEIIQIGGTSQEVNGDPGRAGKATDL